MVGLSIMCTAVSSTELSIANLLKYMVCLPKVRWSRWPSEIGMKLDLHQVAVMAVAPERVARYPMDSRGFQECTGIMEAYEGSLLLRLMSMLFQGPTM